MRESGRVVVTLIALLGAPATVLSWGSDGHRAIGEIASCHLSPRAEVAVSQLLEPGPFGTLSTAGYWADAHARRYDAYDRYLTEHFINVDPRMDSIDLARDCPQTCVLKAIERLKLEVVDGGLPGWRRAEAFRFLVHFVEDLHQPLHVIHPDGRGGNRTVVHLADEETNLHSVWDSRLIGLRLADFESTSSPRIEAWKEWAYDLGSSIGPEERATWTQNMDPVSWATEVIEPARRLTFDVRSGQTLDQAYYEESLPVVELQIKKAAVRLAELLNDLFEE